MPSVSARRYDVAVIVPKPEKLRGPDIVPSETVLERQNAVARFEGTGESPASVWRPQKDPMNVFQSMRMETVSERGAPLAPHPSGIVRPLGSLGGYLVYSPRETPRVDDLREELRKDFIVARDFRVFQQAGDYRAAPGHPDGPQWPRLAGLLQARKQKVTGQGVRYGVIDTGIDVDHAEFGRRRVPFANVPYREDMAIIEDRSGFDPWGHGTHVCSIIAGHKIGIAREGRLHVASVADGDHLTSHIRRIVWGMDWLMSTFIQGQNRGRPIVINLSLGFGRRAPADEDAGEYSQSLAALEATIELMVDQKMLVVAAIGNDGKDSYRSPACLRDVLAVGAVDQEGSEILDFSGNVPTKDQNFHGPDLLGFGDNVLGAQGRDAYRSSIYHRRSGTSQAAAYVSGIAGLYWSMDPRQSAREVRNVLEGTAVAMKGVSPRRFGHGIARFKPPPDLVKTWKGP